MNHDKLYLSNPTKEIEQFAISHGFNRITLNRSMERGDVIWRVGAGVVITHPENTVRGRRVPEDEGILETGYHLPARRPWVPSVPGSVRGKAPSSPWRGWGRPPGCGSRSRTAKQTSQWQASTASWEWDTVGDLTPKSLRPIVIAQCGTRPPTGFPTTP
jgi:hypothetical protein